LRLHTNTPTPQLLTPRLLQSLIEGQQDLDIDGLQRVAGYEDGYTARHPYIRDFWAIVKSYEPEKQRRLLEFVTASDRVPVNGVESVVFCVTRNGSDSEVSWLF